MVHLIGERARTAKHSTRRRTARERLLRTAIVGTSNRRSGQTTQRVYETLRDLILDGQLPQGAHVSIKSIAALVKTSNGPVISALTRLAQERLVRHERGQGYRVAEWTPELLDELLIVRRALETEAARLAARRAGRDDIQQLYQHVERMELLVRNGRRSEADHADVELHVAIARLSRSPALIDALGHSHMLMIVHQRLLINEHRGDFADLAANHRKLVDAIASGDPDRAGRAMHDHLNSAES
jgi:DNA-binding GntR family transcriptional regulator